MNAPCHGWQVSKQAMDGLPEKTERYSQENRNICKGRGKRGCPTLQTYRLRIASSLVVSEPSALVGFRAGSERNCSVRTRGLPGGIYRNAISRGKFVSSRQLNPKKLRVCRFFRRLYNLRERAEIPVFRQRVVFNSLFDNGDLAVVPQGNNNRLPADDVLNPVIDFFPL